MKRIYIAVLFSLGWMAVSAQDDPAGLRTVEGVVLEVRDEGQDTMAVSGARIYGLGSSTYVTSDVDGRFRLQLPDTAVQLKVELFGYQNVELMLAREERNAAVVITRNESFMHDEGLLITIVGLGVVFSALILLFALFKFLLPLVNRKPRIKRAEMVEAHDKFSMLSQDFSGEVSAAISTALHLYFEELHDEESGILTIEKTVKSYSPWSSKIYQNYRSLRGPHSNRW